MDFNIKIAVESLANEKGLAEGEVKEAIQIALGQATKRQSREIADFQVVINPAMDDYKTYRIWHVVDPNDQEMLQATVADSHQRLRNDVPVEFNSDLHLTLEEAQKKDPALQLGDVWREPHPSVPWGRREAVQAKGIITQMVRTAGRKREEEEYADRTGQLVRGKVSRMGRDAVILDLGMGTEAVLPRTNMLPREMVRVDSHIRAVLEEVDPQNRGPQLILNRQSPDMLRRLMELEIPEVGQGDIEIVALVREPGIRAKVSVLSRRPRLNAVSTCIGMQGSRIQNISQEIGGENVDVSLWDENPLQWVANAMKPADIDEVIPDEANQSMDLIVKEDRYGTASGRDGVNIRLVSRLTGWNLNLMTHEEYEEKRLSELKTIVNRFVQALDVEEEIAQYLVELGFTTVEELVSTAEEFLVQSGFDEETAVELKNRAQNARIEEIATGASADGIVIPANDLRELEGMTEVLAYNLASRGVVTMEDLANLSIEELQDIEDTVSDERAEKLIMKAREPWFQDEAAD
ncbi:MAG: transcription termination factor NusA [Gammaproteobacteria bacterium]|nr:transcription termination factor NusA [Gammaproteobacteria bacterium]